MLYFKAPGRHLRSDSPAAEWGEFITHVEVLDDQWASRQIWVFASGQVLRYERDHWCDDFGMLVGLRFSRKQKWRQFFPGVEILAPAAFERVWRGALRSPLWQDQLARSRKAAWGSWSDRDRS